MVGLLERIVQARYRSQNPNDERYWGGGSSVSASGVNVTADTALSYDAFFACVRIIAEDVATLSVDVLRKRSNGEGQDEIPHRLAYLFNVRANRDQNALEWREWMTRVAVMYPEAISEIVPGPSGFMEELRPIHPSYYKKKRLPNGEVRYEVRDPERGPGVRDLTPDQVFRLPSPLGVGLIQLAKDDIGTALAANKTSAVMMKNGLTPRMALEHPGNLSKAAQERLSESVSQNVSGPENAGRIALFEEGMKWIQIGVKPEDAQFISQQEFFVLKMSRWLRMQPHKIAHMVKATYASIEQQNIEHVIDTVRPWLERWESAVQSDLILDAETAAGIFIKHNEKSLLRGDALSQAQYLEILRRIGAMNANEVRAVLEMNPRDDPEGEEYWNKQPGTGGESNEAGSRQTSRAQSLAVRAAERVVAREQIALTAIARKYASDAEGFASATREFYSTLEAMVSENLCVPAGAAAGYCGAKAEEVIREGMAGWERWEARDVPLLAEMALGGTE